MEEIEEIAVDINDPSRTVEIGKKLGEKQKSEFVVLLREFVDIFAWEPYHMPSIPEVITRHSLHIRPGVKPVCKK